MTHSSNACIKSYNYPATYANGQSCTITLSAVPANLWVIAFNTERGFDKLTINGCTQYHGTGSNAPCAADPLLGSPAALKSPSSSPCP